MELGLKNKRALITGSSRGIGAATAALLAKEGCRVWITSRELNSLAAAVKSIEEESKAEVNSTQLDLTNSKELALLLSRVNERWQGLDLLILNLGFGNTSSSIESRRDDWQKVFDLNFFSSIETLSLFLPLLRKGISPSIVAVSSIAGHESIGAPFSHAAAKAALDHSLKEISRPLAAEGIRINIVSPGNIIFPGGRWEEKLSSDPKGVKQLIEDTVPLRRFGTPEEVAACIGFLSSEKASFITGSMLVVDGGQTRSL